MDNSRVVVTGLGVVTPIGIGLPEFWESLLAGTNGIARLTAFDTTGYPSTMAAEVRGFDPGRWIDPKSAARMDRFSQFGVAAADLAMAKTIEPENPHIDVVRALLAAARGQKKAALEAIEPVRAAGRPGRYTYYLSRIYAALGMRNEAIANIETAIDKGFGDVLNYLYSYPYFNNTQDYFYDKLRGEPRFVELQRREERKFTDRLGKYDGL